MKILVWLPAIVPLRLAVWAAGGLGVLAFDLFRIRRKVTLSNLRRAMGGDVSRSRLVSTARRSYVNFARSMAEFASLGKLDGDRLKRMVRFSGEDNLAKALSGGKGVVVVTGHFGSWELLGAATASRDFPVDFLVGEQSNSLVDDLMNRLRSGAGIGIISRGVAARGIFRSLRKNRIVAMLSDQDARSHGIFVDFFGTPASTFPGAAQFAYRAGCPIVFCYILRREKGRHEAVILPQIDVDPSAEKDSEVRRLTEAHVKALEECAREYPDHYFWAHKRWKTRPPVNKG